MCGPYSYHEGPSLPLTSAYTRATDFGVVLPIVAAISSETSEAGDDSVGARTSGMGVVYGKRRAPQGDLWHVVLGAVNFRTLALAFGSRPLAGFGR